MPRLPSDQGRHRAAWKELKKAELGLLREVLLGIVENGVPRTHICDTADVERHSLRSLFDNHVIGHRPGLRLLRFAAQWSGEAGTVLPQGFRDSQERLQAVAGRCGVADMDADFFFRHLERLRVVDRAHCERICAKISGNYYSYRLSRNPSKVIRSHYQILAFNRYNRVPHFVNRLNYGSVENSQCDVERTAQGQVLPIGDCYVFVAFVSWGYELRNVDQYDGVQVSIFPIEQFHSKRDVIDGIFLSYVYTGKYEFGPMKLARVSDEFSPMQVGEFTVDELETERRDENIGSLIRDLMIDVTGNVRFKEDASGMVGRALLSASLSFAFTEGRVEPYRFL